VPFSSYIDAERRIAYCRVSGQATLADFLSLRGELAESASVDASFGLLMDLRGADTSALSSDDLRQLTSEATPIPAAAKRAIVISDSAQYGLARMFQRRRELAGGLHDLQICNSIDEALAWLGAPDFPVPAADARE
jgi:hypothetical protein